MAGSGKAASRLGVDRRRRDVRDSHGLSSRLGRREQHRNPPQLANNRRCARACREAAASTQGMKLSISASGGTGADKSAIAGRRAVPGESQRHTAGGGTARLEGSSCPDPAPLARRAGAQRVTGRKAIPRITRHCSNSGFAQGWTRVTGVLSRCVRNASLT
jgi:hypothetical protein